MNEKDTSWCAFKGQGLGGGVGVTCSWMGEVLGDKASAAARALEFKVWSSCTYLAVVVGDCCDDKKKKVLKYRKVTRPGIEPRTFWTYTRCSNQLSYLALEFSQLILYLCNCQPKDTYSARHIQCHSLYARSTLWPWHDQISQSGNHVTDYIIQFQHVMVTGLIWHAGNGTVCVWHYMCLWVGSYINTI